MSDTLAAITQAFSQASATPSPAADAANSGSENSNDVSYVGDQDDTIARAEESTQDDYSTEQTGDDTSRGKGAGKTATPAGTKETVTITDADGRKRKVEIDYSNREAVKKAHQMAAGARKWQAERDRALQEKQSLAAEHSKLKQTYDTLDKAFQERGAEGVLDLLLASKGSNSEKFLQERIARAKFMERASPEEIEALQLRERSENQARELDRIRQENKKFQDDMRQERETAELRSLEGTVNPVFQKYSFAEKLGNPDTEHMFDEMLWGQTIKRLEAYEAKGVPVSRELTEREFRRTHQALTGQISAQADKRTSRAVAQKKQEATEQVQAKVRSGYSSEQQKVRQEGMDLMNQGGGGLTALLKNMGKYGSAFNKK